MMSFVRSPAFWVGAAAMLVLLMIVAAVRGQELV